MKNSGLKLINDENFFTKLLNETCEQEIAQDVFNKGTVKSSEELSKYFDSRFIDNEVEKEISPLEFLKKHCIENSSFLPIGGTAFFRLKINHMIIDIPSSFSLVQKALKQQKPYSENKDDQFVYSLLNKEMNEEIDYVWFDIDSEIHIAFFRKNQRMHMEKFLIILSEAQYGQTKMVA